ncbi:F0F1 ATP synthase subunit delta [Candidatus Woesebacteria bacterium]|nr:F0F1 ATP synthase subunit delta [Candidatus Woesebacteria bacterium]
MKTTKTVIITTAQKLTDKQRSILKELIAQKIGTAIAIDEIVDTSVIGGIRIQLGNQEFDATISGTLEKVDSLLEVIEVTTADPLSASQRKSLTDSLQKKLGRPAEMIEIVDPSMIAGLRLRVGSKEYDGTFKKRLEKLQATLKSEL